MSLAAMKLKLKHTKGVKVGYKPYWASTRSNCARACVPNIKDSNPSISYNQYTNNLRLGKQSKRGDCCNEIVLDPHKKPSFADKSAEHRIEILTTHHLKDENVEKLKHDEKNVLDGCREHSLNILGDDSNMVRTAEYVLKKRKACLIGKPSEIKTVEEIEGNSLFFTITGRGSILANMDVEVLAKIKNKNGFETLNFGDNKTSDAGIASVSIEAPDNIDYYILKLVPSDVVDNPSVNTQRFGDNNEARETKIILDYYAKINANEMKPALTNKTGDKIQIAGGADAGDADFKITPVTNLIYTLFDTVGYDRMFFALLAIIVIDNENDLKKLIDTNKAQQAELGTDNKKRVAMFDLILKKAKVMGTGFWKEGSGSIAKLLKHINLTPLDKYILNLSGVVTDSSPINSDIHEELKTIYHILDKSADKLKSGGIDDDDWDDITNTISQIIVNEGYIYEGEEKIPTIYDETVSSDPKTKIFDVSTDFGFLDRGDGSGSTNVDYGWD